MEFLATITEIGILGHDSQTNFWSNPKLHISGLNAEESSFILKK